MLAVGADPAAHSAGTDAKEARDLGIPALAIFPETDPKSKTPDGRVGVRLWAAGFLHGWEKQNKTSLPKYWMNITRNELQIYLSRLRSNDIFTYIVKNHK